ncbi:MAG: polysaccharide deacetylase family protein [Clostridia bacterium]|nr:polysaccharide deacetylase family protein [Clostridia bacterium]
MHRTMLFPGFKQKTLTLSYDDGVDDDIRLIDIMQKYGLKGTFNINTALFAPEGAAFAPGQVQRRMTEKQAYALYESFGMEVAVHTCTHPHLETLTSAEVAHEVLADRQNIEQATGKICRGMAYPYGTTSDSVVNVLRACGILYARTIVTRGDFSIPEDWLRLSATAHHNDPQLMELAKKFVEAPVPAHAVWMFYLWGHSYEFESSNNWHVIERFAAFAGGREDIWYATNSEIFEYMEAYRLLRAGADGKLLYNPTDTELFFRIGADKYALAPGKELKIETGFQNK